GQAERNANNEQEKGEDEVRRRAPMPGRVLEPWMHMPPVAGIVDQQHRRDAKAAQRIDGSKAAHRFTSYRSILVPVCYQHPQPAGRRGTSLVSSPHDIVATASRAPRPAEQPAA